MNPLYLFQILLENQVILFCGSSVYITYLYMAKRAYTSNILPSNLSQIHQFMRYISAFSITTLKSFAQHSATM